MMIVGMEDSVLSASERLASEGNGSGGVCEIDLRLSWVMPGGKGSSRRDLG